MTACTTTTLDQPASAALERAIASRTREAKHRWPGRLAVLALGLLPAAAWAQGTVGRSSSLVIPIAAKTASFETEVWVRSPSSNPDPIEVDVLYYEANGLASPGLKNCGFLTISPNTNVSFKLGTQCPDLAVGSHFGLLVLRDRAAEKTRSFAAYSRVQHVTTNQGFSVEAFPENVFSHRTGGVIGLKRKAAAVPPTQAQPGYQANCFVGSLGEAVDYSIIVREGSSGAQIGNTVSGSLAPYQLVRYLDILGQADPGFVGDKENIRVEFQNTGATTAFVSFCTQQDNLSFGADFRITKTDDQANITKLLTRCRGTSDSACSTLNSPASYTLGSGQQHRFSAFINHPDYVRCDIVGPNAGNLEIRLLGPAPAGQPVGPAVAGGNDAAFFYHATGPRNAVANTGGFQTFWTVEVGARESNPPAGSADYGLKCVAGAGLHVSSGATLVTDDF